MTDAEESVGAVRILKGPPIPAILPAKGVGVFVQGAGLRFFVLSEFNTSDTIIRTPVTFRVGMRLLWNLWKGRHGNPDKL